MLFLCIHVTFIDRCFASNKSLIVAYQQVRNFLIGCISEIKHHIFFLFSLKNSLDILN